MYVYIFSTRLVNLINFFCVGICNYVIEMLIGADFSRQASKSRKDKEIQTDVLCEHFHFA
jgi:hypothetical protein